MAGGDASGETPETRPWKMKEAIGGIGGQGIGAGQGGASVPEGEAGIWQAKVRYRGLAEEHGASGAANWPGQPADGGQMTG